jgi:hypothetical protein
VAAKKKKKAAKKASSKAGDKIVVENVNHPGQKRNVDAAKYRAAKAALLKVLPKSEPGLTQSEMAIAIHKALPPGELRDKSSWWMKTVHLDLEAKGVVVRDGKTPLRWRRV